MLVCAFAYYFYAGNASEIFGTMCLICVHKKDITCNRRSLEKVESVVKLAVVLFDPCFILCL